MHGFGELEAAIMDVVWSAGQPLLVRDVLGRLKRDPVPAYNTVLTVMDILYRKGFLQREEDGRAFRYRPSASRQEYAAGLIGEVLDASADRTATLARLFERMDPNEIDELQRALRRAKREQGRS